MESDALAQPASQRTKDAGTFSTSWRTVALTSLAVGLSLAVGSIVALVMVVDAEDADALATIALALAVIAFVVQLVVFVAQLFAGNQQERRGEDIHARTIGLLEGLRGTTEGTQQSLREYIGPLIKAATGAASESAAEATSGEKFDPEEFERRFMARLDALAEQQLRGSSLAGRYAPTRPTAPQRPGRDPVVDLLRSYPDEETGRELLGQLKSLSPFAVSRLAELGRDEISSRRTGSEIGLPRAAGSPWMKELVDAGFVTASATDGENVSLYRLTEAGREAVRPFVAVGSVPDWLKE